MEVTVIVERGADGSYSCYAQESFKYFGLAGYGSTVEEAKKDLLEGLEEIKMLEKEQGREVPPMEFTYKYDMGSFFNYFSCLNITQLAKRAGMNPSLLRQYASGRATASEKQYARLRDAVHELGRELAEVEL